MVSALDSGSRALTAATEFCSLAKRTNGHGGIITEGEGNP